MNFNEKEEFLGQIIKGKVDKLFVEQIQTEKLKLLKQAESIRSNFSINYHYNESCDCIDFLNKKFLNDEFQTEPTKNAYKSLNEHLSKLSMYVESHRQEELKLENEKHRLVLDEKKLQLEDKKLQQEDQKISIEASKRDWSKYQTIFAFISAILSLSFAYFFKNEKVNELNKIIVKLESNLILKENEIKNLNEKIQLLILDKKGSKKVIK